MFYNIQSIAYSDHIHYFSHVRFTSLSILHEENEFLVSSGGKITGSVFGSLVGAKLIYLFY